MDTLDQQVTKFREWPEVRQQSGDTGTREHARAESECDYPDWQALYAAVEAFLDSAASRRLNAAEMQLLLYAPALGNEDQRILETLEQFPMAAMEVAEVNALARFVGSPREAPRLSISA